MSNLLRGNMSKRLTSVVQWLKETELSEQSDLSTQSELSTQSKLSELANQSLSNFNPTVLTAAKKKIAREKKTNKSVEHERYIFTQTSYWKVVEFRLDDILSYLVRPSMYFGVSYHIIFTLPLFMVGYWLISSGVISAPKKHLPLFKSMAVIGTSIGLFLCVIGVNLSLQPAIQNSAALGNIAYTLAWLGQYLLTAGYLGILVLAVQTDVGRRCLSWFAPMGRMALTNYLMHSLILVMIFHGFAGQMYGQIPRSSQVLIVLAIIVCQAITVFQAVASNLWLKTFRFGPLEWLWRCATYLQFQPMKR